MPMPTEKSVACACGLNFSHCSPRPNWTAPTCQIGAARSLTVRLKRARRSVSITDVPQRTFGRHGARCP